MDAIIVAGGIPGPDDPLYPLTQGRPKALLDLAGQPMLQWVVNALEAASLVEHVVVVFPGPESSIRLGPRTTFMPDQGGLIANVQAGLQAVQQTNPAATHALLSSGDIPGITPEMVDWRVQTVEKADVDFDYAVVRARGHGPRLPRLAPIFHAAQGQRGVRRRPQRTPRGHRGR